MALTSLWGRKLGMTQVFDGDKVVPVTAIDTGKWFVTSVKTIEKDGYGAVQVGQVRKKYTNETFSESWLTELRKYFLAVREVRLDEKLNEIIGSEGFKIGINVNNLVGFEPKARVDLSGTSKGNGFAGVVKRHGFAGGRASHGGKSTLRKPGALSFMCKEGRVIKGKKMAGHMGAKACTIKNLKVISFDPEKSLMLVSGAVPGKAGSLVLVRKRKGKNGY